MRTFVAFTLAAALAIPAGAAEPSCPKVLAESWWQTLRPVRTVVRQLGFVAVPPRRFDVRRFADARTRYRALVAGDVAADGTAAPTTPEEKAALLLEALQHFFDGGIALPRTDAATAAVVFNKVRFRSGPLGAVEAHRILSELLTAFPERTPTWSPTKWVRQRFQDAEHDAVHRQFLNGPAGEKFLGDLAELGVCSRSDLLGRLRLRARRYAHWMPVLKAVAVNSVLVAYFHFPPLFFPNVFPLRFARTTRETRAAVEAGDLAGSYVAPVRPWFLWRLFHGGVRSARNLYVTALTGTAIVMTTLHFPLIRAYVEVQFMTPAKLQKYEQQNYRPSEVVEDELQSWIEAQDEPPTEDAIRAKRADLEDQERRGVFRVFEEKKKAQ